MIIRFFLIENYPCNSRDELTAREGQIIRKYKHDCECVNMFIAGRTGKEYKLDNKEQIKQYRLENKERLKNTWKNIVKTIKNNI